MPGLAGGYDPKVIDKLVEAEKIPIEQAKKRKEKVNVEKKEFDKLNGMLSELDTTLSGLKTYADFAKMKVESSHPDIIDGVVKSTAIPGTYEFEVRALARSDKQLAYGFPDKDQTQVGFGYMLVHREDKDPLEITIEPGSTLQDVASRINDADGGVRALVINTKYQPDPFRLLVVSEKSGQEAKVELDPDTTFMEFKTQVAGRNLDVLFEDVPITDDDNILEELVEGVVLNIHRSEPGTRVQVNVTHDIDKTLEGIKAFVDKYNAIADFVNKQFQKDPNTDKAGILAADSSIKTILRQLQSALSDSPSYDKKLNTLADIGITTNPKSGALKMDDAKVKQALSENYESVARLFCRYRGSVGVAEKLAAQLKGLRDPGSGIIKSRMRGLDQVLKNQDQEIARKEEQMGKREEQIRRRFSALDSQMAQLKNQGAFLAAKLGGEGGGG